MLQQVLFYVFSALLLGSALMVITTRNSVRASLFLVTTFFSASVLWLLLEAEFLAVTLVLVYVGAVAVLFLFVVMMLDIDYAAIREGFTRYLPLGLIVFLLVVGGLTLLLGPEHFGLAKFAAPAPHPADYSNLRELARLIYTDYFYPFELAAVILLAAIVAAISLTFRGARARRVQNVSRQVVARPQDNVRIVKMAAVKAESNAENQ